MELSLVIGLIGLLAGASVTVYTTYRKQALVSEAVGHLHALQSLVHGHPGGPLPCAASPAEIPAGLPNAWAPSEGFATIGFYPAADTRFQYEVVVEGEGRDRQFTAIARGDLDGDGVASRFWIRGDGAEVLNQDPLE